MLYATHAEVDLAAIEHNVRQAKLLAPGAKVLVAVKGQAYGHGAVPVAKYLSKQGVADWFGVATTPEGIELRQAGITEPILKFGPSLPEELDATIAADITVTVTGPESIDQAAQAAAKLGRVNYPVQLAVDTGMRRIGCEPDDAPAMAARVAAHPSLELQGVFTHLPISDTPEGAEYTSAQLTGFAQTVDRIQESRAAAGLAPVPLVHAANSGAVLAHPDPRFTMVRPGIMAYGYYPSADTPRSVELRPALSWKSRVTFCKIVPAGQTVGYGRTWTAPVDTWVATVPIGYADGFSRLNSNRGRMLIGGLSYPIAGRVCMDQTMLDLGPAVPGTEAPVKVGDEVVVLGRQGDQRIDADELAALMGTISYEVTCLVGGRVERSYLG